MSTALLGMQGSHCKQTARNKALAPLLSLQYPGVVGRETDCKGRLIRMDML